MVPLYYLLYQVKNRLEYWIAKVDDDHYYLSNKLKDFNSEYEKYILVERYIRREDIKDEINKKQFHVFNPKYDDIIVKETFFKSNKSRTNVLFNNDLDLFNNILDNTDYSEKISKKDNLNKKENTDSSNYDTDEEIDDIINKKTNNSSNLNNKKKFKERF